MGSEFCFTNARELTQLLRSRAVSAREVMAAFLDQIARLNPKINAIVAKLDDELPCARQRGRPTIGSR